MLRLGKEVIVFDGGMGSELERLGLTGIPEELNVTHAQEIRTIHRAYSCADIVTTNTFGLNRVKYRGAYSIEELARAAIENARVSGKKVFFDVGPTGAMLAPLGTLSFDEAYGAFAQLADCTKDLVDGYIAETFSDLYEMKACLLALKEHASKPVFATMTFDSSARTLTGSTPEIVALTLEGLGADALGVNCSLGPEELLPIALRMLAVTDVPVIVQPNRGLPVLRDGRSYYEMSAETFDSHMKKFAEAGVSVMGGCCGTTPEFIEKLTKYRGMKVCKRAVRHETAVCSATRLTVIDGVRICGERLNPTGKKKLKEALARGDYDYLVGEALAQQDAGADLIDLNVGVPGLDEPRVLAEAVQRVQEYSELPIQLDSSDRDAIERSARYYNGIPLVNSVNGEEEVMARVFPVAKKYGAVVLGLCMDENGVPPSAEERFEIAKRIVATAERYGIPRHKIMIDTLVVTAAAEQERVRETVRALSLVKTLGVRTALGVSNVSFGLPARGLLNRTFLAMAMTCGLNMPIMNPLDGEMTGAVRAFQVLSCEDGNAERFIALYQGASEGTTAAPALPASDKTAATLYDCVKKGLKERAAAMCREEIEKSDPMTVVNDVLIKALGEVGELYERGKLFLPQLVSSAEAAKAAFQIVTDLLPRGLSEKGTVVLATVKGDVHDIGKNIVKVVAQSYGYSVVDLGKDVPPEKVVQAYETYRPLAIGLSALMTTTVAGMAETIALLRREGCASKIFVGGAVLNAEIAKEIGADFYTKDALEFVKVLETL